MVERNVDGLAARHLVERNVDHRRDHGGSAGRAFGILLCEKQ